jgi:hypothetical protein
MGYDAVRTERYKFIRYRDLEGMNELYDLQQNTSADRTPQASPLTFGRRACDK